MTAAHSGFSTTLDKRIQLAMHTEEGLSCPPVKQETPALVLRERKPKGLCCIPQNLKHTQTHKHT